mmetsp:Transcript_462/g.1693  ORF Transcript_462/g.1693 Transcript_462/m.1693 type:complete len:442 (-) Transcript_462:88-1413(-)
MSRYCCCLTALFRRRSPSYEALNGDASRHQLHQPAYGATRERAGDGARKAASQPVDIQGRELEGLSNGRRQAFIEKYELKEAIGIGSTSSCYRCVHIMSGKELAVKIIDKRKIEAEYRGLISQFYNEIDILKSLRHPNIIELEEVIESETKLYIVMELMRGGELFDFIVARGKLREDEAQGLAKKIISAVAYMHSQDIIHRDLKPENLLLASSGSEHDLKLIDFGLSKCMHGQDTASFLGTRGYLAPEMLQRRTYSKAVDCWALGIIVFILLCGCLPFDDDTSVLTSPLVNRKFQLRFPHWAQNLSESAQDLLRGLLNTNPRRRLTAEQALNHPWVQGKGKASTQKNYLRSPQILGQVRTPRTARGAPNIQERRREVQKEQAEDEPPRERLGSEPRTKIAGGLDVTAGWQYYAKPSQAEAIAAMQGRVYDPSRKPQKRPSF